MTTFHPSLKSLLLKSLHQRPLLVGLCLSIFNLSASQAASVFVRDTIQESGAAKKEARAATGLVRSAVASRSSDRLSDDESQAEFSLQPRLLKLGGSWVLTVEKSRGDQVVASGQAKVSSIDQLDRAARSATASVLGMTPETSSTATSTAPSSDASVASAPSSSASPKSPIAKSEVSDSDENAKTGSASAARVAPAASAGATEAPAYVEPSSTSTPSDTSSANSANPVTGGSSTGHTVEVLPMNGKTSYWTIGVGPFLGRYLQSDNVMYDVSAGHFWNINPRAAVKVLGETNFSSGNENAHFLNLAAGANFFFPAGNDTAPYLTTDMGYGYARNHDARSAEGFSLGLGAGIQFFRTAETTLDAQFRYAVIFDKLSTNAGEGGYPSVMGVRLAVNF